MLELNRKHLVDNDGNVTCKVQLLELIKNMCCENDTELSSLGMEYYKDITIGMRWIRYNSYSDIPLTIDVPMMDYDDILSFIKVIERTPENLYLYESLTNHDFNIPKDEYVNNYIETNLTVNIDKELYKVVSSNKFYFGCLVSTYEDTLEKQEELRYIIEKFKEEFG